MALATVVSLLGLGLATQPAFAAAAPITVSVSTPPAFNPGAEHDVTVTVTNGPDAPPGSESGSLQVSLVIAQQGKGQSGDFTIAARSGGGSNCDAAGGASCSFELSSPDQKVTLVFAVTANSSIGDVVPGGNMVLSGSSATVTDGVNSPVSAGFSVTLNGPAPPSPSTISGVIDDITTGQPVTNALVNLQDSANHTYLTHSSGSGKFSFTAGGSTPVVAGPVIIGATKKGFTSTTTGTKTFTPGHNITGWQVLIRPVAAASASASATPSAPPSSAVSTPSDGLSGAPSDSGGAVIPPGSTNAASNSGGMSGPVKLVLVVGVLLLLAGAAVAVYLLVRRKRDDFGGDPSGGPGPRPSDDGTGYVNSPAMAMPEPTMMARPGPQGNLGDAPTMVHPLASNMGPARRDAPPTMQRPVDPYQGGGYPGGQGYGAADTTYAAGPAYPQNQPGSGAGYAAGPAYQNQPGSGAGYAGQNRPGSGAGYAGQNQPGSGAGYAAGPSYPQNQPGSGAGYAGQNRPASGAGYGQPVRTPYPDGPGSSGGYGANGYGSSGGYGANGYGSSGGYGQQGNGQQGNGQVTYGQPSRGPVGYEQPDYPGNGYGAPYGHPAAGQQQDYGHGQPAYDAGQYGQHGYDEPQPIQQNVHGQHGYDEQLSYGGPGGYNGQPNYDTDAYGPNVARDNGYVQPGYDANGYAQQAYGDQASYGGQPAPNYDTSAYDTNGYDSNGYDPNGYDPNAHGPANGYADNRYDANGYDTNGYDSNGYDSNGYDANGYQTNGYQPNGSQANPYGDHSANAYDGGPADQRTTSARPGAHQATGAQGGYRGGYVPPDQRGSVDWLDD